MAGDSSRPSVFVRSVNLSLKGLLPIPELTAMKEGI